MSLYTLDHAGAKFVSGLFWQVLSRPREAREEAKELGESMQFDYFVLRSTGEVLQAAFGAKADGANDGMISMAATVARALEADGVVPNWIAATELPNGEYGFFAVRDGAFLPDGDFCGSREEVLNRMTAEYGIGEWDAVVCPDEFGFPNSQARSFEEFLPVDAKGKFKAPVNIILEPLKKKLPIKQMAIAAAVLAVLGGAYFAVTSYLESEEYKERERLLAEQKQRMDEEERRKAMATPPWATLADSMKLIHACEEFAFTLDTKPSGWEFSGATCSRGGSFAATYARGTSPSTVFDIKQQLGEKFRTDWSGEKGTYATKVEIPNASAETLWKSEELVLKMVGYSQELGLKLKVGSAGGGGGGAPGAPAAPVAPASPHLKFKTLPFSGEAPIQPSYYAKIFELPGVRLNLLKVTEAGNWGFEGELYVQE